MVATATLSPLIRSVTVPVTRLDARTRSTLYLCPGFQSHWSWHCTPLPSCEKWLQAARLAGSQPLASQIEKFSQCWPLRFCRPM